MRPYLDAVRSSDFIRRMGRVTGISGQSIESIGPAAAIGEICEVISPQVQTTLTAEVVGVKPGRIILMPYGELRGVGSGSEVVATGKLPLVNVGEELLGRVVGAFGESLDGREQPRAAATRPLRAEPLNPLSRPRISTLIETGVRAIDGILPVGRGQRMGIFAGSGVGKSTLLGMLARDVKADVNVIALIGERGREVREFIEKHLGAEGIKRSVVVVATSDQPALVRTRAAYAATAMAEHFRDQGKQVLLMMDSVTRFAMARREIGLAAGEPPTARGYTPSVFSEIPSLCERCGTAESGGSITAFYTVLVEGDDFNEPISDIVRATLDGHIMLTRELAHEGHFPAIDILSSVSRLATDLVSQEDQKLMSAVVETISLYDRNRDMVDMGAYRIGSNPPLDRAIQILPALRAVLRQSILESTSRQDTMSRLRAAMGGMSA
ncbi:MAG: FliI/YscN family ATPase [Burkholderiales bacterium]|nr:FliI/YscN family ATPase [Burkholderiales bacterium]